MLLTNFLPLMHQKRPSSKTSHTHQRHIAAMVVPFLRLFLAIASTILLLLSGSTSTILLLLSVSTSTVALLRVVEGTLAGLTVDVDPSVVTVVPFGDPWGRDLGRAVVVVGLGWVSLLAVALLERHGGWGSS